ncbi:hypothetical protein KCP74_05785 [Salmonella enterica subsp. enterica]|nr:hypothetical protein KCP74_05785 [Salmonella enterica subsp. enterica]
MPERCMRHPARHRPRRVRFIRPVTLTQHRHHPPGERCCFSKSRITRICGE